MQRIPIALKVTMQDGHVCNGILIVHVVFVRMHSLAGQHHARGLEQVLHAVDLAAAPDVEGVLREPGLAARRLHRVREVAAHEGHCQGERPAARGAR
eukprot:11214212-Lingulodinium_polyedra.AAC.1